MKSFSFQASDKEVIWVMRISILVVGAASSVMAISVSSIYALFYLCADLTYCLLFPQFLCVVHIPFINTYGSVAGYIVGVFLRLAGGEILLSFKPLIKYPWYDDEFGQMFPYKTFAMLMCLMTIICVSLLARCFYSNKGLSEYELEYKLMMKSPPPTDDLQESKIKDDSKPVITSYNLAPFWKCSDCVVLYQKTIISPVNNNLKDAI